VNIDLRHYLGILTESIEIDEGVLDPHIFKAVIMIGPPGAGKSTTANKLFGHSGLRKINIDDFSEMMIRKGRSQGGVLTPDQWDMAWDKVQSRKSLTLDGRLGMYFDSTGKSPQRIFEVTNQLSALGYDIMLILVTASFDTTLNRQQSREQEQREKWGVGRVVDPSYAQEVYDLVKNNIKIYESSFGKIQWIGNAPSEYANISPGERDYSRLGRRDWPAAAERANTRFIGINNDITSRDEKSRNISLADAIINKFLNQPPSKPEAVEWIASHKRQNIAQPKSIDKPKDFVQNNDETLKEYKMDSKFFRRYADLITEAEAPATQDPAVITPEVPAAAAAEPIAPEVEQEKPIEDIHRIASELKFLPTHKQAKKYKFVKGGTPGTMPAMSYTVSGEQRQVITVTSDGKETTNTAEPGDIIMSGPSKENYVVKAAKFPKLYSGDIGGLVIPEQSPRMVAAYKGTKTVTFTAPWGESMILKPGDYLVKDGSQGYYRIASAEYKETYNPPGK